MKEQLKKIIDTMHKYNSEDMASLTFGFDKKVEYDALVVAPSFTPYKLKMDQYCEVYTLREGAYLGGYLVIKDGKKIAWIKTSASDSNVLDHLVLCCELKFKRVIFIGAVGALNPAINLGDVCVPSFSVNGGIATTYLRDSLRDYVPFEKVVPDEKYTEHIVELGRNAGYEIKKASVFCTASIACEYLHLDEIKAFNTDLIEMETATFYRLIDLMEIPGIALLVVSDNSSTGAALVGRTDEEQAKYDKGRNEVLPKLILRIAAE